MNGKVLGLLGGAAVVAAVTLGCSGGTTVLQSKQEVPGITVTGSGSVFGTPDVATVSLGVSAQAKSVGDARTQAAEKMDAMLKALKDGGVADKDRQTTQFTVQPVYDYSKQRQELIGFTVDNRTTVKIRKIDDTGKLIDAALAAGGDLARVDSLTFTIDDPSALQDQARTKAMAEAKHKAETYAQAAGVGLGAPRSINESGGPTPVPFQLEQAGVPSGQVARTPIEVGQLEVRVDVQVVYGLK